MAKILILDEDALARSTLRKAFEQEGYTVSEARRIHAEDALQPWFDFEFVVIDPNNPVRIPRADIMADPGILNPLCQRSLQGSSPHSPTK